MRSRADRQTDREIDRHKRRNGRLIPEDDMTVSSFYWRWLGAAHRAYDGRDDVAGYSVSHPEMEHATGSVLEVPANLTVFMYPVCTSCSNGVAIYCYWPRRIGATIPTIGRCNIGRCINVPPPYGGIKRYCDTSVCLSQPRPQACWLPAAGRPPDMCGLRTRPRTDVDPPRVELPSAGGYIISPPAAKGSS